jgi:tetratricopeptide (TPR) repeat protein
MFCTKCGYNLKDENGGSCPSCEVQADESKPIVSVEEEAALPTTDEPMITPTVEAAAETVVAQPKKNKKTYIIAACIALVVVLGAGLVWNLVGRNNPVNMVVAAFERHDHALAATVFNENRENIDPYEFENALSARLNDLRNEFVNETISYSAANMEISTIRNWHISGLNQQTEELLDFVAALNDSRIAFQLAQTQLLGGDFVGAINNFQLVIADDPNFSRARESLNYAVSGYKVSALADAEIFASGGNFIHAMNVLDSALEIVGSDAELITQRETYRRMEISERISESQVLANENNFTGAMRVLRLLETQNPNDTEVMREITNVENAHTTIIVTHANSLVFSQRYDEAIRELNDGLSLYPNNTALTGARANAEFAQAETLTREINALLVRAEEYAYNFEYEAAIDFLRNSTHATESRIVSQIEEYVSFLPVEVMLFDRQFVYSNNLANFAVGGDEQNNNIWLRRNNLSRNSTFHNDVHYNLNFAATYFRATFYPHPSPDIVITYAIYKSHGEAFRMSPLVSNMTPVEIDLNVEGQYTIAIHMTMRNTRTGIGVRPQTMSGWQGIVNARILTTEH